MEKVRAALYEAVPFKGGQVLVHEDTDAVVIEIHAGCGWRIGKMRAVEKGMPMSRAVRLQLLFSEEREQADLYELEKSE